MKRGFTLIELLAVIAILSIILLIAVPKVLDVINTTKLNAFKANEDMMIKATRIYLAANQDLLPAPNNSIEISLQTLKTNNYIKDIQDPIDNSNCSGYVVVSNLDNKTIYTPHLKCESTTITSSASDGLIANYTFNDFQDTTKNEYSFPSFNTTTSSGNWNHWGQAGAIGTYGQNTDKNFIFGDQPYSHWFANDITATGHYLLYQSPATIGGYRSLTAIIKLEDNSEVTSAKIYPVWNATTASSVAMSLWTSIENLGNGFYLCKINGIHQDGSNDLVGMYIRNGYKAYVSFMQLEQKTFTTPLVEIDRNSQITDYSSNNQKLNLYQETSPSWKDGYYNFYKNSYIDKSEVETPNIRTNGTFNSNYTGYSFEGNWTPSFISGGILRLTYGTGSYDGSFGGEAINFLNNRIYKVTMRIRHQSNGGTHQLGQYNTSLQGLWSKKTITKSTDWQDVSFYLTGNQTYGGWLAVNSGIAVGEYFEIDYIRYDLIKNSTSILHTPYLTLSIWMKSNNLSEQTLLGIPYSPIGTWNPPYYSYAISTLNNNVIFSMNINGIDKSFTAGNLIQNKWNNVVLTFDGTTRKGYVNGEQVASFSETTGNILYNNLYDLIIGQKSQGFIGNNFLGDMDDIRIYNRALNNNEVKALYYTSKTK